MAKTAVPAISVQCTGDGISAFTIAVSPAQNATSPANHQLVAVISGNVTVTPPSGTLYALIVPPSGSTVTKTLKGVAGDTGVPLSLTNPSLISLAVSPGTFVLTGSATESLDVYFF
jgi:hypothetical protein